MAEEKNLLDQLYSNEPMTMRVYSVKIKRDGKNKHLFKTVDKLCDDAKNLYNRTNFLIKQVNCEGKHSYEDSLCETYYIPSNFDLNKFLCSCPEYKKLGSRVSTLLIKTVAESWKGYKELLKKYYQNPNSLTGMPNMPGYLDSKTGRYVVSIDNGLSINENNKVIFGNRRFKNLSGKFKLVLPPTAELKQARIIPAKNTIVDTYTLEFVYEVEKGSLISEQPKRIASIDLGVNNLITMVTNTDDVDPIIINGRPLKAILQGNHKQTAQYQSELSKTSKKDTSKRFRKMKDRQKDKVDYFINNATRKIVDVCTLNNIDTLIVGYNKDMHKNISEKTESSGSKRKTKEKKNQELLSIPHVEMISQLQQKCEMSGIYFIKPDESFTSGTSFIDREDPIKENYNKDRRVKRGLFVSNDGYQINADVNAAYQIMKKGMQMYNDALDEKKTQESTKFKNFDHLKLNDPMSYKFNPIKINVCQ